MRSPSLPMIPLVSQVQIVAWTISCCHIVVASIHVTLVRCLWHLMFWLQRMYTGMSSSNDAVCDLIPFEASRSLSWKSYLMTLHVKLPCFRKSLAPPQIKRRTAINNDPQRQATDSYDLMICPAGTENSDAVKIACALNHSCQDTPSSCAGTPDSTYLSHSMRWIVLCTCVPNETLHPRHDDDELPPNSCFLSSTKVEPIVLPVHGGWSSPHRLPPPPPPPLFFFFFKGGGGGAGGGGGGT